MNHQTRRDDLPDTPWASDALCVDMPAEIFDGTNARLQTAKAACAHCTVARQCLRWAITTEIKDEVWVVERQPNAGGSPSPSSSTRPP